MGPDSDTLIDPVNTTYLGKPVGKDSGINTWKGDQWKIGGERPGLVFLRPGFKSRVLRVGQSSTWNPKQRPGDIAGQ